jgi:NAD-dependent SIR2 family protein deacetylase
MEHLVLGAGLEDRQQVRRQALLERMRAECAGSNGQEAKDGAEGYKHTFEHRAHGIDLSVTGQDKSLALAAERIRAADAFVFAAGAGMGVDSGLPDFRGDEGFWRAYPPFKRRGLSFVDLANPRWFVDDAQLAWGFYGHRLELYRATQPHAGFAILRRWAERTRHGAFVFTSNVDGQFQRAGFSDERVVECHGAIDFLQCLDECGAPMFRADGITIAIDDDFRAAPPLPSCPQCGSLARPAILMFGDGGWDSSRTEAQEQRLAAWLSGVEGKLVVIECGAGSAVPTVRRFSERLARHGTLVRINVREPEVPSGHVGLSMGALAALTALDP